MAEIVEIRKEQMLPEYEEMKKMDCFDDANITEIRKQREIFDYKLEGPTKERRNYLEYIQYEMDLYRLAEKHSSGSGMKGTHSRSQLEHMLASHIKSLYKQALNRYPEDVRLWDELLKFCKRANYISEAVTTADKMVQLHGDKPFVWLRAIGLEYHETNNIERVKDLFLRGLRRHPASQELYKKFFKIMLAEAAKMSTEILENMSASEQSLGLERVSAVYESSKNRIHSAEFLIELLAITEEYSCARKLEKQLIDDLMSDFSRSEIVWHTLAQRELRGLNMCNLIANVNANGGSTEKTLKKKIEYCVEVYQNAVKELKTEKMWTIYIDAMIDLNRNLSTQRILKRKVLGEAFRAAHEVGSMSSDHYIRYIELLMESNEQSDYIVSVMHKATAVHQTTKRLWELWMHYHIAQDQETNVYDVFREAVKHLGDESASLYNFLILYYQTRPDLYDRVEEIYKEASVKPAPEFAEFKAQYIEYVAIMKSISAAREVYNTLVLTPPPCAELHEKMSLLESSQITPDVDAWRRCHEYAIQYFGTTRTDVWINYVKFERDFGNTKRMADIFDRAKASLKSELVDILSSEHCLLVNVVM